MSFQITSANQATQFHGVKVLVYGPPGMGKTVLTATAPNPLMISAESGLLSLRKDNLERLFGAGRADICYDVPVIQINNVTDLTNVYNWLASDQASLVYQTICLDSISEIAEVVLNNAKKQVKDPRQAYGELITQMENLIRLFRDLPGRHVYMAAKMEPQKDETTGIVKYMPSMPGTKLGPKLPYFFDEVLRFGTAKDPQTQQEYRFLQTYPDMQYEGKDRSGALDAVEYPHLGNIFSKIMAVAA